MLGFWNQSFYLTHLYLSTPTRPVPRRPLCITKIDSYLQKHDSPIQIDGLNQAESQPGQGGTHNGLQRNYMSIKQLDFSPQNNHTRLPSSTNNNPST
ncbi:hypothetical protein O181_131688 [Austropuccinia psidii MF-1]|uniref:Uncharacterized protein n=1 Tax=Austropuccinia psidii MF-1 TaxID=1389203 RepID=A0A9Q3L106_9BASI|nr:hypothetical protein [Austropuccinia psidii MF-1]